MENSVSYFEDSLIPWEFVFARVWGNGCEMRMRPV
jgi:hypothetical protein